MWTIFLRKKLFDNSDFSVGESISKLLGVFLKHTITKRALYDFFETVHELLPKPNYLPKNKYLLMKILNKIMPSFEVIKKHRICEKCSHYLGE